MNAAGGYDVSNFCRGLGALLYDWDHSSLRGSVVKSVGFGVFLQKLDELVEQDIFAPWDRKMTVCHVGLTCE